ncbi:MAG: YjbQ family protein [Candidatus Dadabacteria bacterium]|nr:YjbQ family protein [Candidatus Dadabacteria bacterium]NIQ13277.1 YjbQ family protein [Candidatus Dadabacteria bacterium]
MKAYTEYLWFETKEKREFVHITQTIREIVELSKIKEGHVLVSAMHITASVFVNDLEPGLFEDIWEWLEDLAPFKENYKHHQTGEDNGDAHLKNLIMHHQVIIPITNGDLDLGPWQRIFYGEFDGMRRKRVVVKAIGI